VIIQDATLLQVIDVFGGLTREGYVLINTARDLETLGLEEFAQGHHRSRIVSVNATDLAMKHIGRPVPNAALLAAFAALTRQVTLESVANAISETFPEKLAKPNIAAASAAYAEVAAKLQEPAHA
jgi:pyruvate ferredoxin oxidoreductase gamma subunit